ncbi:hypothetical protein RQM59_07500 [Flavobacteriaceae bacterium S356]|uniref:DUF5640 domain-containing protein n=1 Tax=Asprobacillus argus TaxID=3076534 RepID=A0ABU3LER6_9FLAO|nr:hypothetical protein [Flavobacteriaceae bacterium S356]
MKTLRKMTANTSTKLSILLLSILIASFTIYQLNQESQDIIGIWKSDDTPEWKLEFKNTGTCFWYYTGEPTKEFTYSIETTTPQCNQNVPIGDKFSYLKLVDNSNQEQWCYEIFGLDQTGMQIRLLGRSKSMFFTKQ